MANLLLFKDRLKGFYGRYELYLTPIIKFLLALVTYTIINTYIGYMELLKSPMVVFVVSLANSFLPMNAIVVLAALSAVLHFYSVSIGCAVVLFILFLLMFLAYFHFSPKDTVAVLLTPLAFALHIPYVIPLCAGIVGNVFSCVSVSCGVVAYYSILYLKSNSGVFDGADAQTISGMVRSVVEGIVANRTMLLMAVAFSLTIIAVYLIHRLSVDYSWIIALIAGSLVDVLVILSGDMIMDLNVPLLETFIGIICSFFIAAVVEFFIFSVDYTRTEYLQFEDDEYYYYVKAVPKLTVSTPEKRVKKINSTEN